jgi:hypothetical protein
MLGTSYVRDGRGTRSAVRADRRAEHERRHDEERDWRSAKAHFAAKPGRSSITPPQCARPRRKGRRVCQMSRIGGSRAAR